MSSNMMKHLLPKPCSRSEFNLGVALAMFMILNFESANARILSHSLLWLLLLNYGNAMHIIKNHLREKQDFKEQFGPTLKLDTISLCFKSSG